MLGISFDQPINGVTWSTSLQQLTLGYSFKGRTPTHKVACSSSLRRLAIINVFDGSSVDILWPFNDPIDEVVWPASLRRLTFGDDFNQPIDTIAWPASLTQLTFGSGFDYPVDSATSRGIEVFQSKIRAYRIIDPLGGVSLQRLSA